MLRLGGVTANKSADVIDGFDRKSPLQFRCRSLGFCRYKVRRSIGDAEEIVGKDTVEIPEVQETHLWRRRRTGPRSPRPPPCRQRRGRTPACARRNAWRVPAAPSAAAGSVRFVVEVRVEIGIVFIRAIGQALADIGCAEGIHLHLPAELPEDREVAAAEGQVDAAPKGALVSWRD